MQNRNRRSTYLVLSIAVPILVLIILLSSPSFIFSPMVTFIDTDLYSTSTEAVPVRTKTDFASQAQMKAFPLNLGKWEGLDYPTEEQKVLLGGDVMLVRKYEPTTLDQPIFFTVVQARSESDFHPPKVCFEAQGYKIQEEGDEKVIIDNATWVKNNTSASIPFKRLLITRHSKDGTIIERRLVLYCYVKGNQFYSDNITLMEFGALTRLNGTYQGTLEEEKDFVAQSVPLMFEPGKTAQWRPLVVIFAEWGVSGYILIVAVVAIATIAAIYPALRRRSEKR